MPADESRRRGPSSKETEPDSEVVRRGGVANSDAETEDVTRDTYGFPAAPPTPEDRQERIEAANRAAEQAGIPGVKIPEAPVEIGRRPGAEEPQDRTPKHE